MEIIGNQKMIKKLLIVSLIVCSMYVLANDPSDMTSGNDWDVTVGDTVNGETGVSCSTGKCNISSRGIAFIQIYIICDGPNGSGVCVEVRDSDSVRDDSEPAPTPAP